MEIFLDKFEAFIGVNFFTMIFAWVNLLILYIFLRKLLFKPVKDMIDTRQKEIDDMYADAEGSKNEAELMRCEYEERLESAKSESEEILKDARRRALLNEEEILKEATKEADRVLERAREEIALEKKRAINEVKDEVSTLAVELAGAVIESDVDEKRHEKMINEFIENIGKSDDE